MMFNREFQTDLEGSLVLQYVFKTLKNHAFICGS